MIKLLIYSVVTTEVHLKEYLENFRPEPHLNYTLLSTIDFVCHHPEIEVIKIYPCPEMNLRRQSRLAKMCPEKFIDLSGYELTVYVDSNIRIKSEILSILDHRPITLFQHNRRRYILSEMLYCYYVGKMSFLTLLDTIIRSGALNMVPGLYQGGLIFRKVNHEQTSLFNTIWAETYKTLNTDRDQISLAMTVNCMKKHVNVIQNVLGESDFVILKTHEKIVYGNGNDILQRFLVKVRELRFKLKK